MRRVQSQWKILTGRLCCLASTCETVYRSAACRERLREALFESSIEGALQELQTFQFQNRSNKELESELAKVSKTERIDILCDRIVSWYYDVRAVSRVSLTDPAWWYPKARSMRRSVIFHCGPTNSGKTHDALVALKSAKSGVYCAPLKALAAQVYAKLNDEVPCDLLIGDERKFGGSAEHVSCTIEMAPIDLQVDVAVVDEVQLIADRDRGWAWTRAVLGLPARELHLCGEERALPILKALLEQTGEGRHLRVVRHDRLVPLSISSSLLDVDNVENGDCLVCFAKKAIFDYQHRLKSLQSVTAHVVYGALPFTVREAQADAFNKGVLRAAKGGGQKHVLVSTDAIAYGLNMNIRRVVFTSLKKFNGRELVDLSAATIQQVGGRAGRFGLEFSKHGFVTTLQSRDLAKVRQAFAAEPELIHRAGILPTLEVLLVYSELLRRRNVSVPDLAAILDRFTKKIRVSSIFELCDMSRSLSRVAEVVDSVEGLSMRDKIIFCFAPLSDVSKTSLELLRSYADSHASGGPVLLGIETSCSDRSLEWLEWAYRMCEVYCWLSWRFRATFVDQEKSDSAKKNLSLAIASRLP